jgi:hypothetical protein
VGTRGASGPKEAERRQELEVEAARGMALQQRAAESPGGSKSSPAVQPRLLFEGREWEGEREKK